MAIADQVSAGGGTHSDMDALAAMINAGMEHAVPAMHQLGIRVLEVRPGHAVTVVPLAGNSNHIGTMYAGALFGAAELLGGALFFPNFDAARFYPTVKDLQIRYRRPATTDVRARASLGAATIDRMQQEVRITGRTEFVLDAVLTDTSGATVATTHGTYQIRTSGESTPA
ncbi:PaaI family thioesterase [Mycobacteroides franklinii]|nr:YiiD C-terminal domain-containing protein [Mycobacteroides franklinii]